MPMSMTLCIKNNKKCSTHMKSYNKKQRESVVKSKRKVKNQRRA